MYMYIVMCISICIYVLVSLSLYTYIYVERERERDREIWGRSRGPRASRPKTPPRWRGCCWLSSRARPRKVLARMGADMGFGL